MRTLYHGRVASRTKQRVVGLAGVGAAIALLILGAFHPGWIRPRLASDESRIGLLNARICYYGDCLEEAPLGEVLDDTSIYDKTALTTFASALAASFFLLVCGIYALLRRYPNWPVQPSSLALLCCAVSLIAGATSVASNPFKTAGWSPGPGFVILGAGVTAGLIGAIALGRIKPENDDDGWFGGSFDDV